MKLQKTYSLKAPEGSSDDRITVENQNKYVAFYGGIYGLDLDGPEGKEEKKNRNPFLSGGLVGRSSKELEDYIECQDSAIELTSVCSIQALLKQLRSYNQKEFDRVIKELGYEYSQPAPDFLKRKPENL